MANKFQVKRTSVSGRTPNTTNSGNTHFIDTGELALNLTDGKMFSSNGSASFEIGANLENIRVSTSANLNQVQLANVVVSNTVTINNDKELAFKTLSGAKARLVMQSDDNLVLYNTDTTGSARVVFAMYANSSTSNLQIHAPLQPLSGLVANGSVGSAGQTLTSNGTGVYWAAGAGTGTVTQVDTGNGLTGGPITGVGTISVVANSGIIANATGLYVNTTYIATLPVNADNISSGTLNSARLPATVVQNTDSRTLSGNLVISGTYFNPSANTVLLGNSTQRWVLNANTGTFSGSVQIDGDLTVSGNTVTVSATNLAVEDNMIYLNSGSTVTNPDLGFAGNYNDGSYKHAGFFRDATDARWKVFDSYTPEPDASAFIDTSNTSFRIADFQANAVHGSTFTGDSLNIGGSGFIANSTAIVLAEPVTANGATGSSGQVLASNGATGSPYWTTVAGGVTLVDDTATDGTRYIAFANATSGSVSTVYVDSTGLTFNPSTGTVAATLFRASSDEKLKSNIELISNPIQKIESLKGVNFVYTASNTRSIGVIAQDVEQLMPELVDINIEGYRQVNYNGLIGVLIEAVKEQQKEINKLKQIIERL